MPKRSNLFQRAVRVLHEVLGEDALVEESKMLTELISGREREVDVVITRTVAGQEVVVAVEASASGRPAAAPWVEGLLKKHERLPTDKLVLISEAGFSAGAREAAEESGAVPLAPEDLADGFAVGKVLNQLGSIFPKVIEIDLLEVTARCTEPGGSEVELGPPVGVDVFYEDGELFGTLKGIMDSQFHQHFLEVAKEVDLANVTEKIEKDVTIGLGGPFRAEGDAEAERILCLSPQADGQSLGLWPIQHIDIKGKMRIEVGEIPLTHKRISKLSKGFSYGEGIVGESKATFIVSETEAGPKGRMIFETKHGVGEGEINVVDDPDEYPGGSPP